MFYAEALFDYGTHELILTTDPEYTLFFWVDDLLDGFNLETDEDYWKEEEFLYRYEDDIVCAYIEIVSEYIFKLVKIFFAKSGSYLFAQENGLEATISKIAALKCDETLSNFSTDELRNRINCYIEC